MTVRESLKPRKGVGTHAEDNWKEKEISDMREFPFVVFRTCVKSHQWNTRCGKEDLRHAELIEPRATGQPEMINKEARPC